jgi:hypothetical protein
VHRVNKFRIVMFPRKCLFLIATPFTKIVHEQAHLKARAFNSRMGLLSFFAGVPNFNLRLQHGDGRERKGPTAEFWRGEAFNASRKGGLEQRQLD